MYILRLTKKLDVVKSLGWFGILGTEAFRQHLLAGTRMNEVCLRALPKLKQLSTALPLKEDEDERSWNCRNMKISFLNNFLPPLLKTARSVWAIQFCQLFPIKDRVKILHLLQIHTSQSRLAIHSVLTSPLVAAPQIICPCISVLVLEATCEVRMRALKGCVSSKKVLQGFRTETNRVAGRSKKDFHFVRGHCFAFQARKWYILIT